MIRNIGKFKLKTGEEVAVKCVEPPEESYREKLIVFLEHKREPHRRLIYGRLKGDYADVCIDRFFVGEIGGRVASQVWYGLPRRGMPVGNFGDTYTEAEHRKKGIAKKLVSFLVNDFSRSRGYALLCGAGGFAADMYKKYGFEFVKEEDGSGPMVLLNQRFVKSFAELEEKYFERGLRLNFRRGNASDRFPCDKLLPATIGYGHIAKNWNRVFLASQITVFIEALFMVEDGMGEVVVAETSKGGVVGYAFVLGIGSVIENRCKTLDFVMHPNYMPNGPELLARTIELSAKKGHNDIRSYINSGDEEKLSIVLNAGFEEEFRFRDYCRTDGKNSDILVLRKRHLNRNKVYNYHNRKHDEILTTTGGIDMPIRQMALLRGEHIFNLYRYFNDASYRLLFDKSKGYSSDFAVRHDEILKNIIENPGLEVKLVIGCDDICNLTPCPKKRDECMSKTLLQKDRSIAASFGLDIETRYRSAELLQIINTMRKLLHWNKDGANCQDGGRERIKNETFNGLV